MNIPKIINKTRFYHAEHIAFRQESFVILTRLEIKRFVRKICKHFKVSEPQLKFHASRACDSGYAEWSSEGFIKLGRTTTVLVLSHELAHVITKSGHTKRGLRMLEKIILYARKKNYWKKEHEKQ